MPDGPNRQAGGQASRQNVQNAGDWPFKRGMSTPRVPTAPNLRANRADGFPGGHAACHLGRRAGMQTVMRAGRQAVTTATRPRPSPRRRAAALRMRESLRNMKVRALFYNFQHMRFDVSATLCLNGAPDAGRISDAFTKASRGLGLLAVHRRPQRHE